MFCDNYITKLMARPDILISVYTDSNFFFNPVIVLGMLGVDLQN